MKNYATTLIIWLSLLNNELHTLWEHSSKTIIVNGSAMSVQWYVWFACNSIWGLLMGLAFWLYVPNRINRTTVKAYTLFCAWDLVMYFYNYKQAGYEAIYTYLLIAWIIIYNRNGNSTSNRQGNLIAA